MYLPDRCGGHSLVLRLEPDLFHGDVFTGDLIDALVHHTVRALADLFNFLKVVHLEAAKGKKGG